MHFNDFDPDTDTKPTLADFFNEECPEKDCYYCNASDAEAAFWDEFFADPDHKSIDDFTIPLEKVHIKNDLTDEEMTFEGLNLLPYKILRLN